MASKKIKLDSSEGNEQKIGHKKSRSENAQNDNVKMAKLNKVRTRSVARKIEFHDSMNSESDVISSINNNATNVLASMSTGEGSVKKKIKQMNTKIKDNHKSKVKQKIKVNNELQSDFNVGQVQEDYVQGGDDVTLTIEGEMLDYEEVVEPVEHGPLFDVTLATVASGQESGNPGTSHAVQQNVSHPQISDEQVMNHPLFESIVERLLDKKFQRVEEQLSAAVANVTNAARERGLAEAAGSAAQLQTHDERVVIPVSAGNRDNDVNRVKSPSDTIYAPALNRLQPNLSPVVRVMTDKTVEERTDFNLILTINQNATVTAIREPTEQYEVSEIEANAIAISDFVEKV